MTLDVDLSDEGEDEDELQPADISSEAFWVVKSLEALEKLLSQADGYV